MKEFPPSEQNMPRWFSLMDSSTALEPEHSVIFPVLSEWKWSGNILRLQQKGKLWGPSLQSSPYVTFSVCLSSVLQRSERVGGMLLRMLLHIVKIQKKRCIQYFVAPVRAVQDKCNEVMSLWKIKRNVVLCMSKAGPGRALHSSSLFDVIDLWTVASGGEQHQNPSAEPLITSLMTSGSPQFFPICIKNKFVQKKNKDMGSVSPAVTTLISCGNSLDSAR